MQASRDLASRTAIASGIFSRNASRPIMSGMSGQTSRQRPVDRSKCDPSPTSPRSFNKSPQKGHCSAVFVAKGTKDGKRLSIDTAVKMPESIAALKPTGTPESTSTFDTAGDIRKTASHLRCHVVIAVSSPKW